MTQAKIVDMTGGSARIVQSSVVASLPLSLAWSDDLHGDIALTAGGQVDFPTVARSDVRLIVLATPWKATPEELDDLGALGLPICPIFSFLPKLMNAGQGPIQAPFICESHVRMESPEVLQALLEQVAMLRAMGAVFHGHSSITYTSGGYTLQNGSNILSADLGSDVTHFEAHVIGADMRLEVTIPSGPSARPAIIRVATQHETRECVPRFERSSRLMWRAILSQMEGIGPLPYGLPN